MVYIANVGQSVHNSPGCKLRWKKKRLTQGKKLKISWNLFFINSFHWTIFYHQPFYLKEAENKVDQHHSEDRSPVAHFNNKKLKRQASKNLILWLLKKTETFPMVFLLFWYLCLVLFFKGFPSQNDWSVHLAFFI